ncbi:LysR family transcriptional regulator [Actinokineospora bangkokensis]|uniref:HTH lysR-type domain-containing protein n=1 Tax=Actinokineospora bangkokensis TaxID=1193682 RepID=A0A1Q9LLU1_9PSEU|nr:LysR family transcriptional regulator [Actinokineospora bangkokensis]OLR93006.1 hypothetical protein BJP25_18760 [Actinokineospora bangkokensis]
MSHLEVRDLRYFVAVAEDLNFTRAARRLNLAQPALSRAIRQLEDRLGVTLLERTTRAVALTPAGAVFLADARAALAAVRVAETRVAAAAAPTRPLRVVVKPGSDGALLRAVHAAYAGFPPPEVSVVGCGEQAQRLRAGDADVAFLRRPVDDDAEFEFEDLLTEPRVAALPADHRLAARVRLVRADLDGEPIARWAAGDATSLRHTLGLDGTTRPLPTGPEAADLSQLLELVALTRAVAFVPASTAVHTPRPDIAYRPVDGLLPSTVSLAYPVGTKNPAVAAYVRAAWSVVDDRAALLA